MYKIELDGLERLILEMCINNEIPIQGDDVPYPEYVEKVVNVHGKYNLKLFQKIFRLLNSEKFKDDKEIKEIYNDLYNNYDMRMYIKLNYNYEEVLDRIKDKFKI